MGITSGYPNYMKYEMSSGRQNAEEQKNQLRFVPYKSSFTVTAM